MNVPASRPKILVVDDTPANLFAMRRLLAQVDADVIECASGNEALSLCLDHQFALVLLDVNMPDMDGFEVADIMSDELHLEETPIIFVTAAYADDLSRLKGYRSGAVDYIAKPVNDAILLSKVKVFLELYGSKARLTDALASLEQRNEQLRLEIAERRRIEAQMRHQATHDLLTGLPNRALFIETLDQALSRAQRHDEKFGLLYIDIDGFKAVNDSFGHQAGDMLLVEIAQRLRAILRVEDTVARLGGDEFAVVVDHAGDPDALMRKCMEICARLGQPYQLTANGDAFEARVGASIGAAVYPQHGATRDSLIQAADDAMYAAKRAGKNSGQLAVTQRG
ncbi:diguanylate cyclase (GGDEF)-like protein [Pigmentiphaga litoralis]|uniref:Diguanylate cyclase (GGDEF)-like protein n=1 Tax=Pigmentiphaga litoralis TaxID=516702 RepID=A0A7Y9IYU0_9BURK|nr:diguanylate cyclase [Pigmentiphaga litoralis]NYE21766.1 diguanylate cyclase (GGDEF)-like protein [Pigmentiphaga litoralis]NYE84619.1 diguanylate cyclase (GGDEF)-like protein [Pigmentiphaga litoralis]